MKKRYLGLDVIRCMSALFVVLYHYTTRYSEKFIDSNLTWPITFSWGYLAVITFFLLSGFLTKIDGEEKPLNFLKKRFVRLYPAFITSMLLTSLVCFFFLKEAFVGIDILFNLTMIPGILGAKSVDGVYWTLQYEIIFYIITAVLLLIKNTKLKRWLLTAWVGFSIAFNLIGGATANGAIYSAIRIFTMPNYAQVFVVGIVLNDICNKKQNILSYILLVMCVVNHYLYHGIYSCLWLVGFALVILYVTTLNPKTVLNKENGFTKVCAFFASISYALYLVHQNIGYAIIRGLVSVGLTSEFVVLIPIAVSIGLAWVIYRFIETPIAKKLKKTNKC